MHTVQITDGDLAVNDENAELRRQMAALDAEAREHWWDQGWRKEKITDMATVIYEGFKHENLIGQMADVENVAEGEAITVEEITGSGVVHTAIGARIKESSITERVWALPQDYLGYHLVELEEKMQSGFAKKSGQIINLAVQQMDAGVNKRFIEMIRMAIPDTSDYYGEANGLSLPMLQGYIAEVQDEVGAEDVTIFGRHTMVNQIVTELLDQNGFTPETNEQMLRNGVLGTYLGAKIIKLRNYRDRYRRPFIPGNELYVAAKGATKVGFWGGLFQQEWDEPGGWYWHAHGRRKLGMAVRKREYIRRIVDTGRGA